MLPETWAPSRRGTILLGRDVYMCLFIHQKAECTQQGMLIAEILQLGVHLLEVSTLKAGIFFIHLAFGTNFELSESW